ncbi:BF3164 family lipoprotein [Prevotella sp. E13-17]|uniref:BF3164 family lipoprotein n=1 Tax=Prevotella sp. E13-17 TaxID=2913616 RepID=UPI001EDC2E18|nr:BF3164 family lipoprotein [Prevotella sp. E13-17]UKK51096.1 BF3164 family lipoprotein [Prevotella sp. E13-17]
MEKVCYLFLLTVLLGGCSTQKNNQDSYVVCDSIVYVSEFPEQLSLPEVQPLNIEIPGCVDVFNVDSVLICKFYRADYFWHLYSLNTLRPLGNILRNGNAKGELLDLPGSEMDFIKDDSLYCSFDDSNKSSIYSVNLTKTIETGQLSYTNEVLSSDHKFLWAYQLNDSSFFLIKSYRMFGRKRSMLTHGVERDVNPGNINEAIPQKECNAIAATSAVNAEKMMAVEAYLHLPQINLYSLSSPKNVTLSLKPELESYSHVDETSKRDWYSYCGSMRAYQNYFGVVYYEKPYKDEWFEKVHNSSILFFDWEGTPLLKVSVPFQATSFFIYGNSLYIFTSCGEEERIYKYACPSKLRLDA